MPEGWKGPPDINKVRRYETVLSFWVSLCIQFIQSWKQRVCLFSLFKWIKDCSPLIKISSQKLHHAPLTQDCFDQILMTFTSSLHHVLKLCHTSAQNALKSKHGCKGRAIEEKSKVFTVLFSTHHQTYATEEQCWERVVENWIPSLCLPRAHTVHTLV